MSSIVVPVAAYWTVQGALQANGIRSPESITGTGEAPRTFTWTPDLAAGDQTTVADLVLMATFGVTLTLAEWQSIKPDAAGLKAYLGVASPTLAQTASATKAIIRILATIVRS